MLVIFQNFLNTTRRFAARGILENFEISLAVLLPNTTTSHAITYTNTVSLEKKKEAWASVLDAVNAVNAGEKKL